MRILSPSLLFLSSLLEVATADCNANNCLRQVIASAFTSRMARADCSSYMAITVTPATVTVTATNTLTDTAVETDTVTVIASTAYEEPPTEKRRSNNRPVLPVRDVIEVRQVTVSPTAIPAYASACTNDAKYSSACSCIGVTQYTITAAAPLTTTTTSVTITTSTTTSTSISTTSTRTWQPQCSPDTISGGSVGLYSNMGYSSYAGAIDGPNRYPQEYGPVYSVEDCCSACYYYNDCFAFFYNSDTNGCDFWSSDFGCGVDAGDVDIQYQAGSYVGHGPCAGEIFDFDFKIKK